MSDAVQITQIITATLTAIFGSWIGYLTFKMSKELSEVKKTGIETHKSVNSGELFQLKLYVTALEKNALLSGNAVDEALLQAGRAKIDYLEKTAVMNQEVKKETMREEVREENKHLPAVTITEKATLATAANTQAAAELLQSIDKKTDHK